MDQKIRFTRSRDGTRIAFAESGAGPPLVKTGNWLSHLEFDWKSPVWQHWFRFLSSNHRLVRYDARGCGLSDWHADDLSQEAQVADLEAVVDAAQLERFPLLAMSQGGVVAIEYAVRHPERVSKLILYGSRARGWFCVDERVTKHARSVLELIELGWGQDNPAFRRIFTNLFIPEATAEQERQFDELMRITSKPEIASRVLMSFGHVDVREMLAKVSVPTLVIHCRQDACIPVSMSRELAAGIPNAQFVELEGRNHIILENEPAWPRFCEALNSFLGVSAAPAATLRPEDRERFASLTERERQILQHVAQGRSNTEIAQSLFISEKTVRNHLTSIFQKLAVDSRAKAIVLARDLGLTGR